MKSYPRGSLHLGIQFYLILKHFLSPTYSFTLLLMWLFTLKVFEAIGRSVLLSSFKFPRLIFIPPKIFKQDYISSHQLLFHSSYCSFQLQNLQLVDFNNFYNGILIWGNILFIFFVSSSDIFKIGHLMFSLGSTMCGLLQ